MPQDHTSWRRLNTLEDIRPILDNMDEPAPDFLAQLHTLAFALTRLGQHTDFTLWAYTMRSTFPAEIADALGSDETTIDQTLQRWWDIEPYTDPVSGATATLSQWAQYFTTPLARHIYDTLLNAHQKASSHQP